MNSHLQHILNFIERNEQLTAEQKTELIKSLKDADRELEITAFKLDRTEKVKKTTAILLEETIEELEQKRKSVEEQNRELEIESSLERVRTQAMSMRKAEDMLSICRIVFQQLESLGVENIRNVQTVILNDQQAYYTNYEYFNLYDKEIIIDVAYSAHPIIIDFIKQIQTSDDYFFFSKIEGEALIDWRQYLKTGQEKVDPRLESASVMYYYFYSIGPGAMGVSTYDTPMPDVHVGVLKRFRNVFQLAYRRYLDIEQAEAQAREAQIEASLERVRAVAMSMRASEELSTVGEVIFSELKSLGFADIRNTEIIINQDTKESIVSYYYSDYGITGVIEVFYKENPTVRHWMEDMKKASDAFAKIEIPENEMETWRKYREEIGYLPDPKLNEAKSVFYYSYSIGLGALSISSFQPISDDQMLTLERFRNVFGLAYRRYVDVAQAEVQAREAQIEASLERVRSRAMAMHKSDDLHIAVATVFEELDKLNPGILRCGIAIIDKTKPRSEIWITVKSEQGNAVQVSGDEPLDIHPLLQGAYDAWLKQEDYSYVLQNEDLLEYYQVITKTNFQSVISSTFSPVKKDQQHHYFNAVFQDGSLFAFMDTEMTDEVKKVIKRFANVFNLTYKRFLDLQKAEVQTREAQIEVSLERVRSKAMAMHTSEDLAQTVDTFFTELRSLQVMPHRCGVTLIDEETHVADITATSATEDGETKKINGRLLLANHPVLTAIFESWKKQKEYHPVLRGAEIKDYYAAMNPQVAFPDFVQDAVQYGHYFFFKEGGVFAWTETDLSEEQLQIFRKFTSVLSLTYRRYFDLIEAETQAKEAIIDAALERVRGRAMAMHNSNDLSSTASMVFTELRKLGIDPIRAGVGLLTKENRKATIYATTSTEVGDALSLVGWVMLEDQPVLSAQYENWLSQEDFFPILRGKELIDYYKKLTTNFSLPDIQNDVEQHGYYLPFRDGFLYCWTENPYSEAQIKILNRFKAIIDLTFRRYLELQKSEANARDAVRQASLDRVRAETASMRTTHDLEKITPLIWNELTILGVPFIRCGVFIMDEALQLIHTFLSTPEGKAIAAFHLPYESPGNIAQVLTHWKKNEIYIDHWDENDFKEFAEILVQQGALTSPEHYLDTMPQGGFYLHFLPFLQGMLYVGNTIQLKEDEIQLIQSVAYAFSTAYARYEDFNKLDAAKQQVDNTLSDLKQAQQQLIQSEKMASLGELTAGIAHEIQNPLNFVNNFSEVNTELIEEMKQEIANANMEEVKAIAKDIKENQEKITHHGKRADAIVKGMLQHSRTSSSVKEPTDINALADEYLRLAYHGLRAKDKSFNAKMITDFDESIGLINVIPQDMGRVILNLITNAFYAVSAPKSPKGDLIKSNVEYEPTVTISTKKIMPPLGGQGAERVEISVRDNGSGIPQHILDKIFQPFFTTKPTGQGTGLGLSLSYDIVKAHGGELTVKTKEGEGSEFVILLPSLQPEKITG